MNLSDTKKYIILGNKFILRIHLIIISSQEISLLLTVGMAITVEKRDSRNPAVTKKHDKRGLVGLGYGLQQDHPEHIYGHPEPAPIYEEPPPDALHPVPGHFEPAPSSPTASFLAHPAGRYKFNISIISLIQLDHFIIRFRRSSRFACSSSSCATSASTARTCACSGSCNEDLNSTSTSSCGSYCRSTSGRSSPKTISGPR